jgi:hypothetical protein
VRLIEKHYVEAAEYVDGRKVAGVRSLGTAKGQLNVLRDYFGRAACVQLLMVMCANFARPGSRKRRERRRNERLPASTGSAAAALDAFNAETMDTMTAPELVH